jgi:serine/threonine-protein kinase
MYAEEMTTRIGFVFSWQGRGGEKVVSFPWCSAMPMVGLTALLCWSSPVRADEYGAIAFSTRSGAHGYSRGFDNREDAEERALQECGPHCEVVLWFKNACAALAVGSDKGYGTGWASSRSEAESIAMNNCDKNADSCAVVRWVCTSRD